MRSSILACGAMVVFGVAACGDDGGTGGGGGSDPTGSGGAGVGGDGGAEPTTLVSWAATSELQAARDHHVSFIAETPAGAFLYALAGTTAAGAPSRKVERAAIGADGTLGAFEFMDDIPSGLIGPGVAQVDRGIVIAGGLVGTGNSTPRTFVGQVADDGSLTFEEGPELNVDRYHVSLVHSAGHVFAIGGMKQEVAGGPPMQEVMATIERATFDGATLGAFEEVDPLATPVTHHATVAHGEYIYVIGGGAGMPAKTDILRAQVSADGTLGAWGPAGELPEGRATSAAFVQADRLYVVSGMTSLTGGEVATVLGAPIDAEGMVGTFEEHPELPLARAHSHQTPFHGSFVYSVAGSINHVPQTEVFVGTFE